MLYGSAYFILYPHIFAYTDYFIEPAGDLLWGGALFFAIASIMVTVLINGYFGKDWNPYHLVSDSNKLLAVVLSVSLFMFFKDLRIPQSKWINIIAQSCFGVLLIHANSDAMRQWLWYDTLNVAGQYHTNTFIMHSILSVIGIYTVCTIIDQLRIVIIEKPVFKRLNYLQRKLRRI